MPKALLKYLEGVKGKTAADGWLAATRMEQRDLEDESKPVPLPRLLAALRAFVTIAGREAIADAAVHLVAPDNLGGWMRVLRGTTAPVEALDRLDANESDLGRTTRWETLHRGAHDWRGRVHLAHDPALETDGLLRAARMAELSMVPVLFGLPRADVSSIETVSDRGHVQDFEVRWKVTSLSTAALSGLLVGACAGAVPLLVAPSLIGSLWVGAGGLAGVLAGAAWAQDRARRADVTAQRTRVYALERSLLLRDEHKSASGTLEGTVVAGQYRIVRRMGSGGSGVIYEAVRVSDGLPVAIKLLRAVAAEDAIASDRLRREAEALGLAWHPNVVEAIDHGRLADGTSYLVMELLSGEPLSARLEKRGRLTSEEVLTIATQVCDALVAVHAAGVVHRDLKPSNIFLAVPSEAESVAISGMRGRVVERVKLVDFGIARVEWEETRITNIGAPVGTPGYMSPEQEAGGEIDARSDVFAFGAVVFECLTGERPPRNGWSLEDASRPAAGAQPVGATLPTEWRPWLMKAMAAKPADRFPDARAVSQALNAIGDTLRSMSERPEAPAASKSG
jgi:tRNA A-37 threonylcarbamoyl transferase component Bud32